MKSIEKVLIFILVLTSSFCGCLEKKNSDSLKAQAVANSISAQMLVLNGKQILSQPGLLNYHAKLLNTARDSFIEALNLDPENAEANFGFVLTDTYIFWNLLTSIYDYVTSGTSVSSMTDEPSPPQEYYDIYNIPEDYWPYFTDSDLNQSSPPPDTTHGAKGDAAETEAINNYVRSSLENLRIYLDGIEKSLDIVKKHPDFTFTMSQMSFPGGSGMSDVVLSPLKFDLADAYIASVVFRLISGVIYTANAVDWSFDFFNSFIGQALMNSATPCPNQKTCPSEENIGFYLSNLVVQVLNNTNYPNFVGLREDVGASYMKKAGEEFGLAFDDFLTAVDLASMRTVSQEETSYNFFTVQSSNGQTLGVCFYCSVGNVVRPTSEGTVFNVFFPFTDKYRQAFENVRDNFQLKRQYMTLTDDIMPVVALALKFMLGGSPSIDTSTLFSSDSSTLNGSLDVSTLSGFIGSNTLSGGASVIVPVDAFAFDFGSFFANPVGVRDLLPVWRSDLDPEKNNFLLEWDCPNDLDEVGFPKGDFGLFCPVTWDCPEDQNPLSDMFDLYYYGENSNHTLCTMKTNLTDLPHFEGEIFRAKGVTLIMVDGNTSVIPYVPFPDPMFNKLLYLRDSQGGYFALPTNQSLNNFLHGPLFTLVFALIDAAMNSESGTTGQ